MGLPIKPINAPGAPDQASGRGLSADIHDFNRECLRILRCTALALASSPGGLRFEADSQPWLHGIADVGLPA